MKLKFRRIYLVKIVFSLSLVSAFNLPNVAWAQENKDSQTNFDSRDALQRILLSGLVGGVIGLSTLSFYTHPEDHVRNITWGAAAGMIGAALYLTFDAASNPVPMDKEGGQPAAQLVPLIDVEKNSVGLLLSRSF